VIAAKQFLRLALSGSGQRPRVINEDGHPAYASAIAELKQTANSAGAVAAEPVRWVSEGDPIAQRTFIHTIFGIAA
jgi:transposase-like protein